MNILKKKTIQQKPPSKTKKTILEPLTQIQNQHKQDTTENKNQSQISQKYTPLQYQFSIGDNKWSKISSSTSQLKAKSNQISFITPCLTGNDDEGSISEVQLKVDWGLLQTVSTSFHDQSSEEYDTNLTKFCDIEQIFQILDE